MMVQLYMTTIAQLIDRDLKGVMERHAAMLVKQQDTELVQIKTSAIPSNLPLPLPIKP